MRITTQYSGTAEYLQSHWPSYLFGYAGGTVLLMVILLASIFQGWYGFVNLAIAGLLILVYFLIASLWAAHKIFDGSEIIDAIFQIGELQASQTMVYIDLGLRSNGIAFSRRLSTGRIIILDVYNPQLAPARWLARANQRVKRPIEDPRTIWKSGDIDLLPLSDQSAPAVILIMTASEFLQEGDRMQLLEEIHRIMTLEGYLLMVERVRTPTNWLTMGPGALRLTSPAYWHSILNRVGFRITQEVVQNDMTQLFRAEKGL
ncbi:MAG TPA: class I SAM-dependent methyltransferase [candidate division Zixibacteria bacterium]|nr:class I SAM-dependent methyltransferase [candidate division Zixibacteria bacterium]